MTRISKSVLFVAALSMSPLASAEVLDMPQETAPVTGPAPEALESTSLTVPGRGMSMEQVESRFGVPSQKLDAVGEPPITRWVYGDFTVFFEHQFVIHAVTHQR